MKKDNSIFLLRKRLLAIFFAVTFVFCLLVGRLFYLQVIDSNRLSKKALDQWTRDLPLVAERGKIYDREGRILATNTTSFDLYLRPRMVKEKEKTAKALSDVLGLDYEKLYSRLTGKSTSEFTLKKSVDEENMKKITALELPGVYYSVSNKRYYPNSELLGQTLGFISIDGEGQSGLELFYNKYLRGIDGEILTQTDLLGREIEGSIKYVIEDEGGLDLYLTIDLEIQQIVENVLKSAMLSHKPSKASAIVLDSMTGEIVAMGSLPSFDLNEPPRDDVETLLKLQRNTLLTDIYEPGSTFKVLTAAANIEENLLGNKSAFSIDHTFSSSSIRMVDGQRIKCWDKHLNGRHSNLNLSGALDNSCNPIFVDIALSLGKEKMYDYLKKFGYGKTLGIDFLGEASGMTVPVTTVKNCDLARIGFGQTIAVTALQLVSATNAAINGGYLFQPTLMKEIKTSDGKLAIKSSPTLISRPVSEKTSEIMREYLQKVVESGSGRQAKIEGIAIGGKTGTAQKYENGVIASGKYVSSFVGFMPADNPRYTCLVLVDEPTGEYYGSTVSAPLAKMIFEGIISLEK